MKIFVHPFDSAGHVNACLGVARSLAKRGHQIYYVIADNYLGDGAKYGFEEILLGWTKPASMGYQPGKKVDGHLQQVLDTGLMRNMPPLEKAEHLKSLVTDEMLQKFIDFEPQFREAVERIKPDLIVADVCHFLVLPSIAHGKIPWVLIHSSNPLLVYNSPNLPPHSTGFPSYDRSEWNKYDHIRAGTQENLDEYQCKLFRHFNLPEVKFNSMVIISPYLNIYGYPQELDYSDLVQMPSNLFRIEAFTEVVAQPFDFPPEFKSKIKPDDKVVYLSLGSMGSVDVTLMKKIVGALASTSHKYVVSKGPKHDEYDLPENMWGQRFLPQVDLLPLVDLVITHGGNNTVTETFAFGKPMLVMPLFSDQYDNAQRIQEKGFGLRIDPYNFESHALVDAVNRLLEDNQIQMRMKKAAERIVNSDSKDQLCQRLEQIVQEHKRV